MLDITTVCPHNCVYCYHQKKGLLKPANMSIKTFDKILKIIVAENFKQIHLYQSGEPLAHPDFYYFLRICGENNLRANVATKAALPLNWAYLKAAQDSFEQGSGHLKWIIEVPAWSQKVANKICYMNWETERHNLLIFGQMVKHYKKVSIQATTIVTKWNQPELNNISGGLLKLGFKDWKIKTPGYYMSNIASENWKPSKSFDGRFKRKINDECLFPKNVAINTKGDLTVCCHDMLYKMRMGNVIKEGTIKGILEKNKPIMTLRNQKKLLICRSCN